MDTYGFYVVLINMFYSLQEIDEDYIDVCFILTIIICYFATLI